MKINNCPDIQLVAKELESWAHEVGWKYVAASVAHHRPDFHESANSLSGLHNVIQTIRRAFRGKSGHYYEQAADLTPAVLAAMPPDRRARVIKPGSRELRLACVIKRFSGFASTALLDPDGAEKEIDELINSLMAYQQLTNRPKGGGGASCLLN